MPEAPLSLRAALHRIGYVLKLERLAQDIETGTAVDRQRQLLAGQDVERVVRNFGIDVAERDPHIARQLVAVERQLIAVIRLRELRANVRQRQREILRLIEEDNIARNFTAVHQQLEDSERRARIGPGQQLRIAECTDVQR